MLKRGAKKGKKSVGEESLRHNSAAFPIWLPHLLILPKEKSLKIYFLSLIGSLKLSGPTAAPTHFPLRKPPHLARPEPVSKSPFLPSFLSEQEVVFLSFPSEQEVALQLLTIRVRNHLWRQINIPGMPNLHWSLKNHPLPAPYQSAQEDRSGEGQKFVIVISESAMFIEGILPSHPHPPTSLLT